ncbi:MAG: DUF502 domain-containing protein [Taibaiella sp.]|nr:DUF502 domain-containing protein [Taibaiella sp.]
MQGLILLSPIALTGYLLYYIFTSIDSLVPSMPRGIGFLIIIAVVTVIGYLGTRFFVGKWLFDSFSYVMAHTPGIKYIYSSIRDVINSFVGDKKRFNKPVWVCVNEGPQIWRIGFLTRDDMSSMGMNDKVAVYMPHSYAISGWVIIVDRKNVKPVETMTPGEAMKFAVSGGITTVEESENK